jgi:prophage tail gpP-like protein
MSIKIKVNGINYENFLEASVFRTMEAVSGSFTFVSTFDNDNNFPIKEADLVDIFVDGVQVIKGSVEGISTSSAIDQHDIRFSGRDILGDLIDSTVNVETSEWSASSLLAIARAVLDGINLTDVQVIDLTGDVGPFEQIEISSAEVGRQGFDFLEYYARKQQILLNTDGLGNLIFTRSSGQKFPVAIKDGQDGNIKSANKNIDISQRYNSYTCYSQLNPIKLEAGTLPKNIVEQKGLATDSVIRNSRIWAFNAEESSDSFTAKQRAKWEANIRKAKSLSYSCTVQGHSADGNLWIPNRLIDVDDNRNNIHSTLLARSVRYNENLEEGTTTTIEMTYRSAYTLETEQNKRDALNEDDFF